MYDKLLKVQQQLPKIGKDANNPYFNSGYLTLEKLLDKVLPLLNEQGLLLLQSPGIDEQGRAILKTIILDHDSREKHEDEMLLMTKSSDPQAQGSAITYARRYALMSLLGIVPAETDDDGNAATPAPVEKILPVDKMAKVVEQLKDKGITDKEDAKTLIRILSEGKPLNTSAIARMEREIENTMPDTLKEMILNA